MAKKQITALKCLSEMEAIQRRMASPSIPAAYIVGSKFTDRTANGLENAICKFINLSGYQAERIKNVGRQLPPKTIHTSLGKVTTGKAIFIPGTGTNGTPDVRATIQGKSVGLEIKIGRDKMSDAQHEYANKMRSAGGIYYIATNFTDFVKWYCSEFGRPQQLTDAINSLK